MVGGAGTEFCFVEGGAREVNVGEIVVEKDDAAEVERAGGERGVVVSAVPEAAEAARDAVESPEDGESLGELRGLAGV